MNKHTQLIWKNIYADRIAIVYEPNCYYHIRKLRAGRGCTLEEQLSASPFSNVFYNTIAEAKQGAEQHFENLIRNKNETKT